jgi:hypothetical protein
VAAAQRREQGLQEQQLALRQEQVGCSCKGSRSRCGTLVYTWSACLGAGCRWLPGRPGLWTWQPGNSSCWTGLLRLGGRWAPEQM